MLKDFNIALDMQVGTGNGKLETVLYKEAPKFLMPKNTGSTTGSMTQPTFSVSESRDSTGEHMEANVQFLKILS